jgi:adenine C2-methylase RlmN of 23S rRNA A2503 and tRNA A37
LKVNWANPVQWQKEFSEIDDSVNFISNAGKSFLECRYVRREDHQVVVYLSSHNGCKMACRFCHLTSTKQTSMDDVGPFAFDDQAYTVLKYWSENKKTGNETDVNFNFMARGEPFANRFIMNYGHWMQIRQMLWSWAHIYRLKPSYNISTILPVDAPELRWYVQPDTKIYWSLYSPLEKFRKRWLPKAMEPKKAAWAINLFRERGGNVVLHNAFIKGENDTEEQIEQLVKFIQENDLDDLDYNIVAYNPYSIRYGTESERIPEIARILSETMDGRVQVIDRVGLDVHASCGTFHSGT